MLRCLLLVMLALTTRAFIPLRSNIIKSGDTRVALLATKKEPVSANLKKAELLDHIAAKTKVTKTQANDVLTAVTEALADSLHKGKKVTLSGFGTFSVSKRAPRTGRNPATGEPIQIPEITTASFAPSKTLKDKLNGR